MTMRGADLLGEHIERVEILGQLPDGDGNIVEADLMLELQRIGLCSLTVITKKRHEDLILSRHTQEMSQLDDGLVADDEPDDSPQPYVINEGSISPELIEDKFLNHTVWQGLAAALVPQQTDV